MADTARFRESLRDEVGPPGPRPGTVAASVVAVVVLAGAGTVALSGGGSPSAGPTAAPAVLVTSGPDRQSTPRSGLPSGDAGAAQQEPLLVAPRVAWQLFAGVPLPFSDSAGPFQVQGPVYSGFERSPAGALLAATQLGTRYLLTPGEGWRDVCERQVLPGLGRDTFVRLRAEVDGQDPPGTYGQPAGFRFVAYTPDVAVIQEVTRFPLSGNLQVTTSTVKWVDGDWRLELQPDGSTSPTAQSVSDLDGFVVWGI